MSDAVRDRDGDDEPHQEEREETRTALMDAVGEHESDEVPGGADVGAVLSTANSEVDYALQFVIETLHQMMADGTIYESADCRLRPTDPQLVTDGGRDRSGADCAAGALERVAIENALGAAWRTEILNPFDPDYGFSDYFEAAAARNLSLLRGLEEVAESAERRGVLPQSDDDQTKLVTDGGVDQDTEGPDRPPVFPRREHRVVLPDGTAHRWMDFDGAFATAWTYDYAKEAWEWESRWVAPKWWTRWFGGCDNA